MKKHLPSAAVLLSLLLVLCMYAFTSDRDNADSGSSIPPPFEMGYLFTPIQGDGYADFTQVIRPLVSDRDHDVLQYSPDILVNGMSIGTSTPRVTQNDTVYVSVSPILRILYPEAQTTMQQDVFRASGPGIEFAGMPMSGYFRVNGRFFYVPSGNLLLGSDFMVPLNTLSRSLGCTVTPEDPQTIIIRRVGPAAVPKKYNDEDLYWLSRIIYAEAGNQIMAGRVAVGTVILNRVANDHFPNTIKDVIFAPNQFSPVSNGMIYREPDYDSTVAAMLCLDGVKEAGDSLYFNVTRLNSWANKTKTYVTTIGDHKFYM